MLARCVKGWSGQLIASLELAMVQAKVKKKKKRAGEMAQ